MAKKPTPLPEPETLLQPKPLRITSLSDLQLRIEAPLIVQFALDGQPIEIEARRLPPSHEQKIQALRRSVPLPPKKKAEQGIEYYDREHPPYQEAVQRMELKIRALTLYEAVPCIAAGKPGLSTPDDILTYVSTLFTDDILEFLYLKIRGGGLSLEQQVSFTSPPGSLQS